MSKRAVIYVRLATTETPFLLARVQETQCRAYCESHNYTVVGVYRDIGVPGHAPDRPGLAECLDAIDAGKADVLVTYDSTRLSRDSAFFATCPYPCETFKEGYLQTLGVQA